MRSQDKYEFKRRVVVPCSYGLGFWVAVSIARLARRYQAELCLESGGILADAKSLLSILLLGAARGEPLNVLGRGSDAERAVRAIYDLFKSKKALCGEEKDPKNVSGFQENSTPAPEENKS